VGREVAGALFSSSSSRFLSWTSLREERRSIAIDGDGELLPLFVTLFLIITIAHSPLPVTESSRQRTRKITSTRCWCFFLDCCSCGTRGRSTGGCRLAEGGKATALNCGEEVGARWRGRGGSRG
jgi:hypothetical protein